MFCIDGDFESYWSYHSAKTITNSSLFLHQMISHQLATEIEPKVDESLHDVITSVLDQVSLDEVGATSFTSLGAGPDAWRTG